MSTQLATRMVRPNASRAPVPTRARRTTRAADQRANGSQHEFGQIGIQPAESTDSVASELFEALQNDPLDSSRVVRNRLKQLDPIKRQSVVSRLRSRLGPQERLQLNDIFIEASATEADERRGRPARHRPQPTRTAVESPSEENQTNVAVDAPSARPTPSSADSRAAKAASAEGPVRAASEQTAAQADDAQAAAEENTAVVEAKADEAGQQAEGQSEQTEDSTALPRLADRMEPVPEASVEEMDSDDTRFGSPDRADGMSGPESAPPVEESISDELGTFDVQGLVANLTTASAEAKARVEAEAQSARADLMSSAETARTAVRTNVARAVESLRSSFATRRSALQTAVAAAHAQISTQLVARLAEATTQGDQAKQRVQDQFNNHRTTIETAVNNNIDAAERMRTTYAEHAHRRTDEQFREAYRRGRAFAQRYPGTTRGAVQYCAAMGVAEKTAEELKSREPETIAAIEDVVAPIPDEFVKGGEKALEGYDSGLPQIHEGMAKHVLDTTIHLSRQADEAHLRLDTLANQMLTQIDAMESAAIARAEEIGPQAEAQIDVGLRTALHQVAAAVPQANGAIDQITGEAVDILLTTEEPDPDKSQAFADQVITFISGAAEESVASLVESKGAMIEEFRKAGPATQEGVQAVQRNAEAEIQHETAASDTAITNAVQTVDTTLGATITRLGEAFGEVEGKVSDALSEAVNNLQTKFDEQLQQAEAKVVEAVDEGLAKNDEALSELEESMSEAASDAAWDYDHPILSAVRDVGAFIAGAIIGIVMVLALVVAVIVAFKLLVAGLILLGLSAVAASIVAAVIGVGLLAYGIYQAYSARVEAGESGWSALGGAVQDLVGITDIRRSFSEPGLSPFERGLSFGRGIATIGSFFLTRGMNRRINARMPASVTNPSRGAIPRAIRARFGGPAPAGGAPPVTGTPAAAPLSPAQTPTTPTIAEPPVSAPPSTPAPTQAAPTMPASGPAPAAPRPSNVIELGQGPRPASRLSPGRTREVTSLADVRAQRAAGRSGGPPRPQTPSQVEPVAAEATQVAETRLAAGAELHGPRPLTSVGPQAGSGPTFVTGQSGGIRPMATARGGGGGRSPPTLRVVRSGSQTSASSAGRGPTRPARAGGRTPPSRPTSTGSGSSRTPSRTTGASRPPARGGGSGGGGGRRPPGGGGRPPGRGRSGAGRARSRRMFSNRDLEAWERSVDNATGGRTSTPVSTARPPFSTRTLVQTVRASMRALRSRGIRGVRPSEYGTSLHAEVARRLGGRAAPGWQVAAEQPLSSIVSMSNQTANSSVRSFLAARPQLSWLERALPRKVLETAVGELKPDLLARGPGGQNIVWDLTSRSAAEHLAKTVLYATVVAEESGGQKMIFSIGESFWRAITP